jgi:hypothetical protein
VNHITTLVLKILLPAAKGINKVAKKIYKLGKKKEITKAELLTLFIFKHIKHNISIIEIVVC